jgi:hypothetical protein
MMGENLRRAMKISFGDQMLLIMRFLGHTSRNQHGIACRLKPRIAIAAA